MDCGRRPHLPKMCAQIDPPPSANDDFDRFRVIVPQTWELARIAIIANRKSTTRFLSSYKWTMCVTPKSPKGGLKREFLHLVFPFISSQQVNFKILNFKFNTWVEYSKSKPTDDKPSLKWAWPRHVTHFKFFAPQDISKISKFVDE